MKDIKIFGKEFNDVVGFKMPDTEDVTVTYTEGGGGTPVLETVTKTYTPTTSQQTETITPSSGYDGIGEVDVTVNAMPEGTLANPVAVKGEITNHSMVVTPFVLTQAGYIPTQAKQGTAVSVSASELVSGTKSITANGTGIDVTNYAAVDVAVSGGSPSLQTKTKSYTPTTSQQTEAVSADSGYDGLDTVNITVNAMPTGSYGAATWSKAIQQNKLFVSPSFANFDDGYFSSEPNIAASLDLETKSVTPSETAQTVTPTNLGYYLSSVNVGAIPSNYVGSGITQRSSSDLSASGATVTAPAGYYGSAATKTIASGSATTPATTIDAEPVIDFDPDTGEMSVALNKTQSITPTVSAGYVSSGTAGNVTVTGSDSFTLDVQSAATYYPSASDQTIAGDQWLSGAQTIKAVTTTNLTAANIKSGVVVQVGDSADSDRVLSVTGTYSGGGSAPTPYTQMNTGSVTIASRYQTTGNRLIVSLANVGFTPKQFLLIATSSTVQSIYNSQDTGTESNGVVIYADYVSLTDGTNTFYARSESRLNAKAMSGGRVNTAWTTQTNNYLYNNGTNIYFRTASNYGLPANGVYNWIAFA